MKYATILAILAIALVLLGIDQGGVAGALLIWLAGDFLLLGIAHARKAHRVFGKRADGTLPWWSWLVFLPLHILNLVVWHLFRLLSSEPRCSDVSHRLAVGRRLLAREWRDGFVNYVDLTAEFSEPQPFRGSTSYVAFPILDASAPSPESLRAVITGLRSGKTFIHCAQGHGRTGLFAAALLLSNGDALSVDEALSILVKARPAIRLNESQLSCLKAFARN